MDPPPRVGRLRRTVFAAAGAVAAGGVLVVANPAQGPAFAATPAPLTGLQNSSTPAAAELRAILARTTAMAPERRRDIDWMRLQSWSLNSEISKSVTSAVVPEETEIERRGDGSATITIRLGEPVAERGGIRDRVETWWKLRDEQPRTESFGAGGYPSAWPVNERPPTNPATLRNWLLYGSKPADEAEVLRAVNDLSHERTLRRDERAALLTVLTDLKNLRYAGRVTDRAERAGEAFTLDSAAFGLPIRYTLVLDSATGAVLSMEELLTGDAPGLNVKAPAVIKYTTFTPVAP
ncbi:hypothetical protein [Pilimelia anulata]|uniref:hypothetical protein n=1 Tax=Pilimelia anulata TaxID=53371 RepID=UPI00166D4E51|nr:hypothetical protein [Pilimelia anulata]